MCRPQYRIRSLLIVCSCVAVLAAWAHDHNRLRKLLEVADAALAEEKLASQKLADELSRRNQLHARSRREFDEKQNGPYQRIPETHPAYTTHGETISKLKDLGVQLYVNRHDDVILADVPDTTNFEEVFTKLKTFPTLGFVNFTLGALPDGYDWDSEEFRNAYAEAGGRAALRTFELAGHFRRDAYAELRGQLPHVETTERPGAFW